MTPVVECPSVEALRRSLDQDSAMTHWERQTIEQHVEHCDRGCKNRLEALLRGSSFPAATSLPWAIEDEPAPPTVPGYYILEELGRGGMGVVYKARHRALDRIVALKQIQGGAQVGPADLQRFRTEAEAVARLRHPNVVQIHDVGDCDGLPYLTLEFCPGGTLASKLNGTPLPPQEAARLAELLARGLQAAHGEQVIHRDLKPHNVLLTADGTPKITDFGLAKKLDTEGAQTQTGVILGTPSYMAPEQARGDLKAVGPLADVYGLGAILYEMLTGRPPFKAATPMDTAMQVLAEEPVSPRRLQPKTPRDLETICLKCLHKEPAKRYASALALAEDLRRYQTGEPIQARPVGPLERSWRWCRRQPALAMTGVGAGLAVGLFLVTLTVAFVLESESAEEARELAEQKGNLAVKEKDKRIEAVELLKEKGLLVDQLKEALSISEERRKKTDRLTVRLRFENIHFRCPENPAVGILGLAQALQATRGLEDAPLEASLRLHLGHWSRQVHPLLRQFSLPEMVFAVAFSPNGKVALTGGGDKSARLWDTASGQPLGQPLYHQGSVMAGAFSPDGKIVLTGGGNLDKTARMWDAASGQPLGQPLHHQSGVVAVAFSPDSKTALTGSWDKTSRLWDTATGQPLGPNLVHQDVVWAVAFSPDGKTILTGSKDKTARLWDATSGQPLGPVLRHLNWIRTVAFSPDGKSVLTGSDDMTARLWEATSGQPLGKPLQHNGGVMSVAFSPDGKTILTGCIDKTARLWDATNSLPLGFPLHHQGSVMSVTFNPDSKTVLTGSLDKTARLWEVAKEEPLGKPLQHRGPLMAVAFSPDGKAILTGSLDKTAQLWDAAGGQPLGPPLHHQDGVMAVAFSPVSKTAITGSKDKTARRWDATSGESLGPPLHHQDQVLGVAFSPDGKTILSGSNDKTARLWDAANGKPLEPSLKPRSRVRAVAFSPDGKTVLAGCEDKLVRLWEAASGKELATLEGHTEPVSSVTFSPDGKTVLTGSEDKTARLWDASSGKPLGPPLLHQGVVRVVAFSPDGKTVLTGSWDKTARLWEADTGKPLGPPLQHQGAVNGVAFSPDGKTFLTGCGDKAARLWQMREPLRGDPNRLLVWAQVVTGLKLDDRGAVHVLNAATWEQRRQHLHALGGQPGP